MNDAAQNNLSSVTRYWVILAIILLVLSPLAVCDIPLLLDYPNHLARAYILALGTHDPALSKIYAPHWAVIPNVALDILLLPLLHIFPVYLAGKITIGLALIVPTAGVAAYHGAGFNRRSAWPWTSALIAFNALLLLGMLNFLIALGAALLGAALWLRYRHCHAGSLFIGAACFITGLFFLHIFSVPYLLVIIAAEELVTFQRFADKRAGLKHTLPRIAALLLALVPVVLLYVVSPTRTIPTKSYYMPFSDQIWELFFPVVTYWQLEQGIGILLAGAFVRLIYGGFLRVRTAPMIAFFVMAIAAIILPFSIKDTTLINGRMAVMAVFLFWAGTDPIPQPKPRRTWLLLLILAILAVRMSAIATVWHANNQDIRDLERVIATVPAGSKVMTVAIKRDDNRAYWDSMARGRLLDEIFSLDFHLPALLVIERHAFWPFLFADPGKQPIRVLSPYDGISSNATQPPSYLRLSEPTGTQPSYMQGWQQNFDYVLVLEAGGLTKWPFPADQLQPVAQSSIANLYKIIGPQPGRSSPPRRDKI